MKRIAFVALSSRVALAAGIEPGTQVFVGDLRDGVSVGDLQRLVAAHAVEVEVLPGLAPLTLVAPATMEKPRPTPVVVLDVVPADPPKPVVIENAAISPRVVNDPAAEAALRDAVAKDEAAKSEPEPKSSAKRKGRRA